MQPFLQKQLDWFFSEYRFKNQSYWFKCLLYALLIVKSVYWLLYYDFYFGANSIVFTRNFSPSVFTDFVFFLYGGSSPTIGYVFIIPLLVISLFALVFRRTFFVTDLIIWFLILNLHNKIYPALTGGSFLLNQLLLFNCFLSFSDKGKTGIFPDIKILLHNLSVVGLILQICIVYFLSALAKCADSGWTSGAAISDLAGIKHFNLYNNTVALFLSPLSLFVSYLILVYQLCFPFLIWIRKVKIPLIIIGIVMHLYIAFVMGLTEFGIIMMLPYIFFWPVKKPVS